MGGWEKVVKIEGEFGAERRCSRGRQKRKKLEVMEKLDLVMLT